MSKTDPNIRMALCGDPLADPMNAISFAAGDSLYSPAPDDASAFLNCWREGDLSEWSEYVAFVDGYGS